jgi:phosphoglucosamine mutase
VTVKFGTDGLRGLAIVELTPELVLALGRATARVLVEQEHPGGARPSFLIGRDTRLSGPLLQAALSVGLASEGVDVCDLGVLPTPAVAALAASRGVPAAVISASHNPYTDNGIKLFASGGRKLDDKVEARLEAEVARLRGPASSVGEGVEGTAVVPGRLRTDPEAASWYGRHLIDRLETRDLGGMRVAIDCANGAASALAADVLIGAGAHVVALLAAEPDGININAGCGSTYPARLQEAVVSERADVGLAFDGDADRVIAVDHAGALVDGDQLMALFALDLRQRHRLAGDTVVVTVMTNLGFRLAMERHGVVVQETQVGDRYVLEALDQGAWSLGGEQSGHIIFRDLASTGDGLLTGLLLVDLLRRQGRPLAELAAQAMVRLPQVLQNVRVVDRDGLAEAEDVWTVVADVERVLHGRGRVLLRPSGTEPLIRVMVEAPSEAEAAAAAGQLVDVVTRSLGSGLPA